MKFLLKKRLSWFLAITLLFSNSFSVFAGELTSESISEDSLPLNSPVSCDTVSNFEPLQYTVIEAFEDAGGNIFEQLKTVYESDTDNFTVWPKEYDGYETPDAVSVNDISEKPVISFNYIRKHCPFNVRIFEDNAELSSTDNEKGLVTWDKSVLVSVNGVPLLSGSSYRWGELLDVWFSSEQDITAVEINGKTATSENFVLSDNGILIPHIQMPNGGMTVSFFINSLDYEGESYGQISENTAADKISENGVIEAVSENIPSEEVSLSSDTSGTEEKPEDNPIDDTASDKTVSSTNIVSYNTVQKVTKQTMSLAEDETISENTVRDEETGYTYIVESLTEHSLTLMKGQKKTLIKAYAWESSDSKVAAVNKNGKITGKSVGTAKITRFGDMNTEYSVNVVEKSSLPAKTNGYISGNNITVCKGKSLSIVLPDKWSSSDRSVVTVDKQGRITCKNFGEAIVTVVGTHNRQYMILVDEPEIIPTNNKLSVPLGSTINLNNELIKASVPIMYSVKNTSVARVDMAGNLTAIKTGSTKLYANANGKKYIFTLKVIAGNSSGGMINAQDVYLLPKKSFTLKASFLKKEAKKTVKYSLSGENVTTQTKRGVLVYSDKVASVTEKGKITGISDGTTYVTVNIGGVNKYTVRVIVEGDLVSFPKEIDVNANDYCLISTNNVSQQLFWSSSNKDIATVNEYGVVAGVKKGCTKVSCKVSGKKYSIKVNVKNAAGKKSYVPSYDEEEVLYPGNDTDPKIVRKIDKNGTWKIVYVYFIRYDLDGGSADNPVEFEENDVFSLKAPAKEGCNFIGWTGSNGNNPSINVVVKDTGEHKYYKANYSEGSVTVKFDTQGGTAVSDCTVTYNGRVQCPVDPKKDGFALKNWLLDGAVFDFSKPVIRNITLKAEWVPASSWHTVSFNSNGGSAVESQNVADGFCAHIPERPRRDGYSFVKWVLNGEDYDFSKPVTENMTLMALWSFDN